LRDSATDLQASLARRYPPAQAALLGGRARSGATMLADLARTASAEDIAQAIVQDGEKQT
jgi:hypothetical protein